MFAACILFALPTIKETWIMSDTHPVYNHRYSGLHDTDRDLVYRGKLPIDSEQGKVLLKRKAALEAEYRLQENKYDTALANYRKETAKPMPNAAQLNATIKQINDLRRSISILQQELNELVKEFERFR